MSDLGDELRDAIDGAAPPVTFDEVVGRSTADRPRRAPWQTTLVAAVVVAALVAGAVVLAQFGDGDDASKPHIAAPTVTVGDIDLAVLSTSFDEDGARGPIDPGVVDTVRSIPGVAGAQGAMQRFVDVVRTDSTPDTEPPASERSAIAISWEEGAPLAFSAGGTPQGAGEIAINQSLAAQYQVGVGDELVLNTGATMGGGVVRRVLPSGEVETQPTRPSGSTARVVGVFTPAGGDVDDINLVVMRAGGSRHRHQPPVVRPRRHRRRARRADRRAARPCLRRAAGRHHGGAAERGRLRRAVAGGARDPTRVPLGAQPRPSREDGAATFGAPDDPESMARNQQTYDANLWQTVNTELRVSRGRVRRQRDCVGHLPCVLRRCAVGGRPQPDDRCGRAHRRRVAPLASGVVRAGEGGQRRVRGHRWPDGVGLRGGAERLERGRLGARSRPSVPHARGSDDDGRAAGPRGRPGRAAARRHRSRCAAPTCRAPTRCRSTCRAPGSSTRRTPRFSTR